MNELRDTGPPMMQMRLLLFKEDSMWIAQCLDYDIAAQASTYNDVKYEFEKLVMTHIVASLENGDAPFGNMLPAPQEYWDIFRSIEDRLDAHWPEFTPPLGYPANLPRRPSEVRVLLT